MPVCFYVFLQTGLIMIVYDWLFVITLLCRRVCLLTLSFGCGLAGSLAWLRVCSFVVGLHVSCCLYVYVCVCVCVRLLLCARLLLCVFLRDRVLCVRECFLYWFCARVLVLSLCVCLLACFVVC